MSQTPWRAAEPGSAGQAPLEWDQAAPLVKRLELSKPVLAVSVPRQVLRNAVNLIKLRVHLNSRTKMTQNSCGKPRQTLAAPNSPEPSLLLGVEVPKVS